MERRPEALLRELNAYVSRAQRVLAAHVEPDSSITCKDAINELLGILDDRELVLLQEQIPERPALFAVE